MKSMESDLAARKAAADAMGVHVQDVILKKGIPEYRPKEKMPKPKRTSPKKENPKKDILWTDDGR